MCFNLHTRQENDLEITEKDLHIDSSYYFNWNKTQIHEKVINIERETQQREIKHVTWEQQK